MIFLSVHACSFIDRPPSSPQTRRLLECALGPSSCSSSSSWPRPSAPSSPPSLPAHARLFPPSVRGVPPGWLAGRPDGRARACVVTLTALPSFLSLHGHRQAGSGFITDPSGSGGSGARHGRPAALQRALGCGGWRATASQGQTFSQRVRARLPACLFALSVYLPACLPVCLSVCLLVCLLACLSGVGCRTDGRIDGRTD